MNSFVVSAILSSPRQPADLGERGEALGGLRAQFADFPRRVFGFRDDCGSSDALSRWNAFEMTNKW